MEPMLAWTCHKPPCSQAEVLQMCTNTPGLRLHYYLNSYFHVSWSHMTLGDWYVSPAHNAPHQEPWQMLQDLRQRSALQTDFGVEFTCYSWPISIIFKIHYLVLTIMINLVTDEITSELAVSVGKHPTYSELKSPGHFSSYHETNWLFFLSQYFALSKLLHRSIQISHILGSACCTLVFLISNIITFHITL